MSAYREIKTEFRNAASLRKALEELGIVCDTTSDTKANIYPLFGYQGDQRPETVNIRIRRHWVNQNWSGGSSNDIGFAWDGKQYVAIVSEYDRGLPKVQAGLDQLRQRYAVIELRRQAKSRGYNVTEQYQEDGSIRLQLVRR